eukprot:s1_g640.t1
MPNFQLTALSVLFVATLGIVAWIWDQNSSSGDEEVDQDLLRMGGSLYMNMDRLDAPFYEHYFYSVRRHLAAGSWLSARSNALSLVDTLTEQDLTDRLPEANELLAEAIAAVNGMSDDEVWEIVGKGSRANLIGSSYETILRTDKSPNLQRSSIALRHICVELTKLAKGTQGNLEELDLGTDGQSTDDHEYYVEQARHHRHKAIKYCIRAFDSNEMLNSRSASRTTVRRLEDIHFVLQTLFEWNEEPDRGDEYLSRLTAQLEPIRLAHELRELNWVLAAARIVAKTEEQKTRLATRMGPAFEKALIVATHLNNLERLRELNNAYGALLERQGNFSTALPFYQAAYQALQGSPGYREDGKLATNLKELAAYPSDGDPLSDATRQLAALPDDAHFDERAALEIQKALALFRHLRRPEGFAALGAALDIYKTSEDKLGAASVLMTLSEAAEQDASLSPDRTPISYLEEAADLYAQGGDKEGEFTARYRIAKLLAKNGDQEDAIALFEELKATADARNEDMKIASASMHLSNLFRGTADERALEEATECGTIFERAGIDLQLATCLVRQGKLLVSLDRKNEACPPLEQALALYHQHAYPFLARDVDGLLKRAGCQPADSD